MKKHESIFKEKEEEEEEEEEEEGEEGRKRHLAFGIWDMSFDTPIYRPMPLTKEGRSLFIIYSRIGGRWKIYRKKIYKTGR
jgi:hypothetical protein